MFIVMEIQSNGESISTLVNTYDNRLQAESKYHTILASASISTVPKHSAVLMTEEGQRIKNECYEHIEE